MVANETRSKQQCSTNSTERKTKKQKSNHFIGINDQTRAMYQTHKSANMKPSQKKKKKTEDENFSTAVNIYIFKHASRNIVGVYAR